jgi:hypothetical protein
MSSQTGIQEPPGENGAAEATVNALGVVSQELLETIQNAHLALEDSIDGRGGSCWRPSRMPIWHWRTASMAAVDRPRWSEAASCCTR